PGAVNTISPINIPGNSTGYFTWTYSATGEGEVTFTGRASGTDQVSGAAINSANTDTTVTITGPSASLAAEMSIKALSSPVAYGQRITVILSVTNMGIADARAVSVTAMNLTGAPVVTLVSGPSVADRIGAYNQAAYFTWIYDVGGTSGTLNMAAVISGMNDGTSVVVSASDDADLIVSPSGADFEAQLSANVSTIGLGEVITVVMTVSNVGQQSALAVLPFTNPTDPLSVTPTVAGTGNAVCVSGPVPLSETSVADGSSVSFTWTFSATAGGNITFNGGLYWTYNDPIAGIVTRNMQFSSAEVSIQYGVSSAGTGDRMVLSANSINPLAGETVDVIFSVAQPADSASILVYNVAGQKVRTIVSTSAVVPDITYTQLLSWDGRADDGMFVTTGIYYIKLKAGSYESIRTVAVIKK
ncbi:MAG TPA: FlgD immunoglobulin-like domain containing protein, partial [Candidatus Goldiibacteriota bacterium]|nr:FlgD immunoglobulin-like domain containing protein [Candidatus Goldiibacteriota bacterium]